MVPSLPPSTAVRIASVLVTGLLVLATVFGAVALVSMGIGVVRGGESLLYGETLRVPMQVSTEELEPLPDDVSVQSWVPATVEVHEPTVTQMLLQSASGLGPLLVLIGALWLVRGVLTSVMRGDPFGPGNVRRLRSLGLLLALGGSVVALLDYSLRRALFEQMPPMPAVDLGLEGPSLPVGVLLGGLAAFVLSAVFAHGSQLREDVEGTI